MLLFKRYPSLNTSSLASEIQEISQRPFAEFVRDVIEATELSNSEADNYLQQLDKVSMGTFNPYFYWDAWPAHVADNYRYLFDPLMQILHRRYLLDCIEKGMTLRDLCMAIESGQDESPFEYIWFLKLLAAAKQPIAQSFINHVCGCLLFTKIELDSMYSFMQDNNLKFDVTTVFCSQHMNASNLKSLIMQGGLVPSNLHICLWFANAIKKNDTSSAFFKAVNEDLLEVLQVFLDYGAFPSFNADWTESLQSNRAFFRYDHSEALLAPEDTPFTLTGILNQDADDVNLINDGIHILVSFLRERSLTLIDKFVECYDHCKGLLSKSAWAIFEDQWMKNLRNYKHKPYFLVEHTILLLEDQHIKTWLLHVMLDYPLPYDYEL